MDDVNLPFNASLFVVLLGVFGVTMIIATQRSRGLSFENPEPARTQVAGRSLICLGNGTPHDPASGVAIAHAIAL